MSERIFNVSRSTKTGKTVNVGDFPTVEQAQAAMLSHYKVTPKRGDFRYRIFEEELEEINGVTFRKFCLVLSGGNKPYSKSYTTAELKALVESCSPSPTRSTPGNLMTANKKVASRLAKLGGYL